MNKSFKIISISLLLSSLLISSELPSPFGDKEDITNTKPEKRTYSQLQKNKKGNSYFEYDAPNGWWWYKEEITQKDGKKIEVKTKLSKKEKLKFEAKKETNELLKEQIELLSEMKKRLNYAFPYVAPIYTKDERTGKKCLTNSSEHCFILPVQAEAQRVPVMAQWLRNPSPTNSKKWLRWEAKYFNQLQKISLGNRFAYLSGGSEAYPTNTVYSMGDSIRDPQSIRAKEMRKKEMIDKVMNKMNILIFLGKTSVLDSIVDSHKEIYQWSRKEFQKYNVKFIFENKYSLELFEANIKKHTGPSTRIAWKEIKKAKKVFVSKKYFDKFNIKITPSVVAIYKTDKKQIDKNGKKLDKNEMIWQTILTSSINPVEIKGAIFRFLEYNGIFKAKDLAIENGFGAIQKNVKEIKPDINESKIYKDTQRIK